MKFTGFDYNTTRAFIKQHLKKKQNDEIRINSLTSNFF